MTKTMKRVENDREAEAALRNSLILLVFPSKNKGGGEQQRYAVRYEYAVSTRIGALGKQVGRWSFMFVLTWSVVAVAVFVGEPESKEGLALSVIQAAVLMS